MTTHGANLQGLITFQLAWWGFVLGAKDNNLNLLMVATALTAVAFILHYRLQGMKPLLKVLGFACLGFALDSLMARFFVIQFFSFQGSEPSLAPLWLAGLWLIFVLSLQSNSKYLLPSRKWAYLLYGVGGPLTYWLCQRFGLVQFAESSLQSFAIMIPFWLAQTELWTRFLVLKAEPTKVEVPSKG